MTLGEAGADYLCSASRGPTALCRPSTWSSRRRLAEIFETPCVAFAPDLAAVPALAATSGVHRALGDAAPLHPGGPAAAVGLALEALRQTEHRR